MGKAKKARVKSRKVWLAALNVKADPHPTGTYERLFRRAASASAKPVKLSGDRTAELDEVELYLPTVIVGELVTYLRIDPKKPVRNIAERKVYTKAEKERMLTTEIREAGLNEKRFWFAFDIETHTFVYERRNMSTRTIAEVLAKLLSSVRKQVDIDDVTVVVHKDEAVLERIWNLKLETLEITVTRPNPDDLADLGERIRARLAEQNAKEETFTLVAEEGQELKPDAETKELASVGLTDGSVTGIGYDPELKRKAVETTESAPLAVPAVWNPKEETAPGFFSRMAATVGAGVRAGVTTIRQKIREEAERVREAKERARAERAQQRVSKRRDGSRKKQ